MDCAEQVVLINPQLKPLWSTGTVDKSCAPQGCKARLELTETGSLQLVAANGTQVWSPPGVGRVAHATQLTVQDDCNVVSDSEPTARQDRGRGVGERERAHSLRLFYALWV